MLFDVNIDGREGVMVGCTSFTRALIQSRSVDIYRGCAHEWQENRRKKDGRFSLSLFNEQNSVSPSCNLAINEHEENIKKNLLLHHSNSLDAFSRSLVCSLNEESPSWDGKTTLLLSVNPSVNSRRSGRSEDMDRFRCLTTGGRSFFNAVSRLDSLPRT